MQDLAEQDLAKDQMDLVGKGYAGPAVSLGSPALTEAQVIISLVLHCTLTHMWHSLIDLKPGLQRLAKVNLSSVSRLTNIKKLCLCKFAMDTICFCFG